MKYSDILYYSTKKSYHKTSYDNVICPSCKNKAFISLVDANNYWISDAIWSCPCCSESFTTLELHKYNQKK